MPISLWIQSKGLELNLTDCTRYLNATGRIKTKLEYHFKTLSLLIHITFKEIAGKSRHRLNWALNIFYAICYALKSDIMITASFIIIDTFLRINGLFYLIRQPRNDKFLL